MRNAGTNLKDKLVSRYLEQDQASPQTKVSDINILLNRVRLDRKRTFKKRIIFSIFLVALVSSLTVYFII